MKTPLLLTLALLCTSALAGQSEPSPEDTSGLPTANRLRWSVSQESWKVSKDEQLGMVAGRVLFEVMPHFQVGAATYGAVRGQRGGFITLGPEVQWQHPLTDSLDANVGLFVGAGGGRDGQTLAGGGLMLRTQVGLEKKWGSGHRVGLGLSRVSFPDGIIRSTQPYLSYAYEFDSRLHLGWPEQASGFHLDDDHWLASQEVSLSMQRWHFDANATRNDGSSQARHMQMLGIGWAGYLTSNWYLHLQSHGALGGQSAGYMQILPGVGYRLPIGTTQSLQFQAAVGPAGGGGVNTGGGTLLEYGVHWQWRMLPRQSLQISLDSVNAPGTHLRASSVGIALVHHLQDPSVTTSSLDGSPVDMERFRMRLTRQHYTGSSPDWRCCEPQTPVDNLGLQLDYMLSPRQQALQWFLTGQGIAAYQGHAGAYMTGLIGLGLHHDLGHAWYLEAEALTGAAGGGGMHTGGGWVGQVNAGLGYQLTNDLGIMVSTGRLQAIHGPMRAKVNGLTLVYKFGRKGDR